MRLKAWLCIVGICQPFARPRMSFHAYLMRFLVVPSWIIYIVAVSPYGFPKGTVWCNSNASILKTKSPFLYLIFILFLFCKSRCDCLNSCSSIYVLIKRLFSTKVAVKWNLNWDFGNGQLPEYHMIILCLWESTSYFAEAINLSLARSVSLLYNQNSVFQYDGIVHLIRCCQCLQFI